MQSFVERPHFCSPLWPHGVQGYCSDIARSTRSEKCSHKQVNSTSSCIALNPVIFFWGRPLLGSLMWKINPVLGCSEESNIDVFHPVCRCCTVGFYRHWQFLQRGLGVVHTSSLSSNYSTNLAQIFCKSHPGMVVTICRQVLLSQGRQLFAQKWTHSNS